MTAEMPRTKPNIMITARLLLMPVLRSVELKEVLCAKAVAEFKANRAASSKVDRNRGLRARATARLPPAKRKVLVNFFIWLLFCFSEATLPKCAGEVLAKGGGGIVPRRHNRQGC